MSTCPNSRRNFLKLGSLTAFGVVALGSMNLKSALAADAAGAKKLVLVEETEAMAKTLGFHRDAAKVDVKKWTKRAAADGKTQFCRNCILFNGGKVTTDAEGPCSLFPGKAVPAGGWCNSWAKNPAAK